MPPKGRLSLVDRQANAAQVLRDKAAAADSRLHQAKAKSRPGLSVPKARPKALTRISQPVFPAAVRGRTSLRDPPPSPPRSARSEESPLSLLDHQVEPSRDASISPFYRSEAPMSPIQEWDQAADQNERSPEPEQFSFHGSEAPSASTTPSPRIEKQSALLAIPETSSRRVAKRSSFFSSDEEDEDEPTSAVALAANVVAVQQRPPTKTVMSPEIPKAPAVSGLALEIDEASMSEEWEQEEEQPMDSIAEQQPEPLLVLDEVKHRQPETLFVLDEVKHRQSDVSLEVVRLQQLGVDAEAAPVATKMKKANKMPDDPVPPSTNGGDLGTILMPQLLEMNGHQAQIQQLLDTENQKHVQEMNAWEKHAKGLKIALADEPFLRKTAWQSRENELEERLDARAGAWQSQVSALQKELASLQLVARKYERAHTARHENTAPIANQPASLALQALPPSPWAAHGAAPESMPVAQPGQVRWSTPVPDAAVYSPALALADKVQMSLSEMTPQSPRTCFDSTTSLLMTPLSPQPQVDSPMSVAFVPESSPNQTASPFSAQTQLFEQANSPNMIKSPSWEVLLEPPKIVQSLGRSLSWLNDAPVPQQVPQLFSFTGTAPIEGNRPLRVAGQLLRGPARSPRSMNPIASHATLRSVTPTGSIDSLVDPKAGPWFTAGGSALRSPRQACGSPSRSLSPAARLPLSPRPFVAPLGGMFAMGSVPASASNGWPVQSLLMPIGGTASAGLSSESNGAVGKALSPFVSVAGHLIKAPGLSNQPSSPPGSPCMQSTARTAQELLDAALMSSNELDALFDAVMVCRSHVAELDMQTTRRLGAAEERLRSSLDMVLKSALRACNPPHLSPEAIWPTLRRTMLRFSMAGLLDSPALREARETAANLRLSLDSSTDPSLLHHFQKVFDHMHIAGSRQTRLRAERVVEMYSSQAHARYLLRRATLARQLRKSSAMPRAHIASQEISWAQPLGLLREPLDLRYNECYLFYCTSVDMVAGCNSDTTLELDTTGQGVYLSEYAKHAQEMSTKAGGRHYRDSDGRIAIVVCRAFCGRLRDVGPCSSAPSSPVPATLREPWWGLPGEVEPSCYNSTTWTTLGEDANPTSTREFLLASDQVFPEFVVFCSNDQPNVVVERSPSFSQPAASTSAPPLAGFLGAWPS